VAIGLCDDIRKELKNKLISAESQSKELIFRAKTFAFNHADTDYMKDAKIGTSTINISAVKESHKATFPAIFKQIDADDSLPAGKKALRPKITSYKSFKTEMRNLLNDLCTGTDDSEAEALIDQLISQYPTGAPIHKALTYQTLTMTKTGDVGMIPKGILQTIAHDGSNGYDELLALGVQETIVAAFKYNLGFTKTNLVENTKYMDALIKMSSDLTLLKKLTHIPDSAIKQENGFLSFKEVKDELSAEDAAKLNALVKRLAPGMFDFDKTGNSLFNIFVDIVRDTMAPIGGYDMVPKKKSTFKYSSTVAQKLGKYLLLCGLYGIKENTELGIPKSYLMLLPHKCMERMISSKSIQKSATESVSINAFDIIKLFSMPITPVTCDHVNKLLENMGECFKKYCSTKQLNELMDDVDRKKELIPIKEEDELKFSDDIKRPAINKITDNDTYKSNFASFKEYIESFKAAFPDKFTNEFCEKIDIGKPLFNNTIFDDTRGTSDQTIRMLYGLAKLTEGYYSAYSYHIIRYLCDHYQAILAKQPEFS
jgi:hypothetical protein